MPDRNPSPPGPAEDRDPAIGLPALKAFAHPLRMRMYRHLQEQGSATSAQLARALDESTGQTSYHLRQLERHGFVSEDTGRGTARERWWTAEGFSFSAKDLVEDVEAPIDTSSEAIQAALAVSLTQIDEYARAVRGWLQRLPGENLAWRWVNQRSQVITELTPEELTALNEAFRRLLDEHLEAARRRRGGGEGATHGSGVAEQVPGERRVQVLYHAFPLAPHEE